MLKQKESKRKKIYYATNPSKQEGKLTKGSRFYVPVWNGLLTAKHRREMGAAVWTYLVLIDMTPKQSKTGWVSGGALIQIDDISKKTGFSWPQVQRDLEKLKGTYIDVKRSARGFKLKIRNWRPVHISTSNVDRSDDISTSKVDISLSNVDSSLSNVDISIEQEELEELEESTYVRIFECWNSAKIIVHQDLTNDMNKAADKALSTFPIDSILSAIKNYGTVLNSEEYIWSHRWTLEAFLIGGGPDRIKFGNLKKFVPESKPLENYRKTSNGQRKEPAWMAEARERKEAKENDQAGV